MASYVTRHLEGRGKAKRWKVQASLGHRVSRMAVTDLRPYCTTLCDLLETLAWPEHTP